MAYRPSSRRRGGRLGGGAECDDPHEPGRNRLGLSARRRFRRTQIHVRRQFVHGHQRPAAYGAGIRERRDDPCVRKIDRHHLIARGAPPGNPSARRTRDKSCTASQVSCIIMITHEPILRGSAVSAPGVAASGAWRTTAAPGPPTGGMMRALDTKSSAQLGYSSCAALAVHRAFASWM